MSRDSEIITFINSSKNYGQWRQYFVNSEKWGDNISDYIISYIVKNETIHLSFIPEFINAIYNRLRLEQFSHIILKWQSNHLDQFSSVCTPNSDIINLYIRRGQEKLANFSHHGNLNISYSHVLKTILDKSIPISEEQLNFFLDYPGDLTQEAASYVLLYGEGRKYLDVDYLLSGLEKSPYISLNYIEYLLEHYESKYQSALEASIEAGLMTRKRELKKLFEHLKISLLKTKMDKSLMVRKTTEAVKKI